MNFGLTNDSVDKIKKVFAAYPEVSEAILYGSRAKGNFKRGSDIDITLKGEGLDLCKLAKISNQLDDLSLPYTFDFSIYNQITNEELLEHINRVGAIFYSNQQPS